MSPQNKNGWDLLGFLLLTGWFWLQNGWKPLALILFAAAIHEAGHLLMLRLFGVTPSAFHLSPVGAELLINRIGLSYGRELAAVLAGPAANLLFGTALVVLAWKQDDFFSAAGAHFVLAAFNLLPIRPLDGGRGLQILLSWRWGPDAGDRFCRIVGTATAVLLTAFLFWLMAASGGNLWLAPVAFGVLAYGCMEFTALRGHLKAGKNQTVS